MVQIIAGRKGKGKTKYLLEKANAAVKDAHGSIVYVDKCTQHMHELNRSCLLYTSYYYQLINDQSSPLYNAATQAQTAPGSVFKPITAIAALESGVVTADELVETKGVFTELGLDLSCWLYSSSYETRTHGLINTVGAISGSCNYYFSEMGYRLSLDDNGNYNESKGVQAIQAFASAFGLDTTSGIEIREREPQISDTAPVPSAIGQGTHRFSNVQLARYVTALANSGTVYNLTLLDSVTDTDGNVVVDYQPEIANTTDFSASTWDTCLLYTSRDGGGHV